MLSPAQINGPFPGEVQLVQANPDRLYFVVFGPVGSPTFLIRPEGVPTGFGIGAPAGEQSTLIHTASYLQLAQVAWYIECQSVSVFWVVECVADYSIMRTNDVPSGREHPSSNEGSADNL